MTNTDAYAITAQELRQFIEQYEHLEAEKKDLTEQQGEVMAEAKGRGYCCRTIKKVIAARKKSADERSEEDAVFRLYAEALGL